MQIAAWLEILVGVTFVTVPNLPCQLLLDTTPQGVAILLVRFSGVALIGLGTACVPSQKGRRTSSKRGVRSPGFHSVG